MRADHPFIQPIAEGIRAVSRAPVEQVLMVDRVTRLLVDYDSDQRVYGRAEYHASLDEMIQQARAAGWPRLRDDCDGRALFAAHLLSALQLPWQLESSPWKRHAWVSTVVAGKRYDLLDLGAEDPELQRRAYRWVGRRLVRPTNPPPTFDWRRAWAERTREDLSLGLRLGLLEPMIGEGWRQRYAMNWAREKTRAARGALATSAPLTPAPAGLPGP